MKGARRGKQGATDLEPEMSHWENLESAIKGVMWRHSENNTMIEQEKDGFIET